MQILNTLNVPYETVNILEDERLRSGMKEYSQWPTFPQVHINGEFYGGCDIMIGELCMENPVACSASCTCTGREGMLLDCSSPLSKSLAA